MKDGSDKKGPQREVVLECPHRPLFDPPYPVPDDTVYCRYCQDYRRVLRLYEQYAVRCVNHCRFSQGYGTDLAHAEQVAHRHSVKYGARVYIRQGDTIVADIQPEQETLFPEYEEGRRRKQQRLKDHQAVLRKFMDGIM